MNENLNTEETMDAAAVRESKANRARRKVRIGKVVSSKMNKSVIVTVARRVKHPLYKKYFTKTTRFMAHDEKNDAGVGDTVKIMETRPLSARKRWRLVEIVEKAK
jgi:small subunit ribosomal protein S17